MANRSAIGVWRAVHRWTSLSSMAILLILCITGLPLVFRDEIVGGASAATSSGTGRPATHANLDRLVDKARGQRGLFPGEDVRWISIEQDRPEIWMGLSAAQGAEPRPIHMIKFDARTGTALHPAMHAGAPILAIILKLHTELLAGAAGEAVLALIAILFVIATASGIVLYGPFMRKLPFGTVRQARGARKRWLDIHNLTGIVAAAWVLVVGVTGGLNAIADPVYDHWRGLALQKALALDGNPAETWAPKLSVEAVLRTATTALPEMRIRSIRFPDAELGSPHHYLIWATGGTPLTSRLLTPALIDARTGLIAPVEPAPWYLKLIQLSRPLHFGDYGGLPLKILWALLDMVTIVVLGSGLYLWIARPRRERPRRVPKACTVQAL